MPFIRHTKRTHIPFTPIAIFVLAVLVPSIALSFLALRAAEREAVYVERRLESALMAEVGLTAARIEGMMDDILAALDREAAAFGGGDDALMARWSETNPLVDTPFRLIGGRVETVTAAGRGGSGDLRAAFGDFLEGRGRLPTYDLMTRIYRYDADTDSAERKSPAKRSASAAIPAKPLAEMTAAFPAPMMSEKSDSALEESPGMARRMAQNLAAPDAEARDEPFERASREGFEILRRNVAARDSNAAAGPDASGISAGKPEETRSQTVVRSRSFDELSSAEDRGLLPILADGGLEILFWTRSGEADEAGKRAFVGCTLRMDLLKDRIAGVIPGVLSDARILTVLDDAGVPIAAPEAFPRSEPDWGRPFAAREISPELPRWEVGAWLADPEMLTSRAGYARLAVWVAVAALSLAIITGSAVIIRAMSYEMRAARQRATFVASVSHEFKTPLTSIRLFAELMASGRQVDEHRRRSYLQTIVSETDRLSRLVEGVLTLSHRGGKYQMRCLSLSEVARDTLAQLEPHLAAMGFFTAFSDEGPMPVMGDREALKQVIMNMLSNAEKYSGRVREISVTCRARGGSADAVIEDRGIGVDPKLSGMIFQEFYRADDSLSAARSGAGLGLSIARSIARAHGGDVTYAPRAGGGSSFTLSLPLSGDGSA
jgi:signal transduction histidine kinase